MNTRLRTHLKALGLAAGAVALGFALGDPPIGLTPSGTSAMANESIRVAPTHAHRSQARASLAMPFFSFARQRASGAP